MLNLCASIELSFYSSCGPGSHLQVVQQALFCGCSCGDDENSGWPTSCSALYLQPWPIFMYDKPRIKSYECRSTCAACSG